RACSQILREIEITLPIIICANKMDLVSSEQLEKSISIIRRYFITEDIVPASIKTGQNLDEVLSLVSSKLRAQNLIVNPGKPQPQH
ncbi:MAG: hypothetical protein WB643_08035, partial [Candidatus Bathyarchaeia archaeon]